ncbi:MAG: D-alanyl-D-alanine carboxypeptidase/D-alanyl-D-alanine-endopeptidase [Candidatus Hinthialibacter antarcticus]|nr:D-alanyl-D-alanine carboxypeptidase/D-alanyl-D-alanine-endopeptidase [Candidatus Hinthialibacter antarcticus]
MRLFQKRIQTAALAAAVLFLSLSFSISAQAALRDDLNTLFQENANQNWSVLVYPLNGGKPLYSLAPERKLIPASNIKLFSGAAALLQLGPDFRYETKVHLAGARTGNVWKGALIVEGGGDPSIGGRFNGGDLTETFRQWAAKLKLDGITTIDGDIIGVDDYFDDVNLGLNWDPGYREEWYSAEVSALSYNDACIDLIIRGEAKAGQRASITLDPPTSYLKIDNKVTTASSSKNVQGVRIERIDDAKTLRVSGSVRAKRTSTHFASTPNPTLYFVTVLKETLEREGITITGGAKDADEVETPDRNSWNLLLVHRSEPLERLLNVCLKNSQNLYAEHFLKTLGAEMYGIGSYTVGAMAVKSVLFQHGCNLDSIYLADGSGLSRENRANAQAFVDLLRAVERSPHAALFKSLLPESGSSGTLKSRMKDTAANGRVLAKTGTLNGVRGLSGYISSRNGTTYAFSMIGNTSTRGYRITQIIDSACALIAEKG